MSDGKRDYKANVQLTRLYRKKSQNGNTYFTGRLGYARISLLKSKEVAENGDEIWNLLIQEAPPKEEKEKT